MGRGVKIKMITDGTHNPEAGAVNQAQQLDDDGVLALQQCQGACWHSGGNKMHNKFMLIDNMAWQENADLVLQMTGNWSNKHLSQHFWNSALQSWADRPMYWAYLAYYDAMENCAHAYPADLDGGSCAAGAPSPNFYAFDDTPADENLNLFPQSADPVLAELGEFDCEPMGTGQTAEVDIAMSEWDAGLRGTELADEIKSLTDGLLSLGCTVRIVVQTQQPVVGLLGNAPGVQLRCTATSAEAAASADTDVIPAVHEKYLIYRGPWRGSYSTIVSTGSLNFLQNAFGTNDNNWLTLTSTRGAGGSNAALYEQYAADFLSIWSAAAHHTCASGPGGDVGDV